MGMPAGAPADGLCVLDVRFAVGTKQILRGVSIDAHSGATTALLGPSGCGKTTLLRVIAGLEQPDSGSVVFNGEDVTGVPAHRRGFGMMFQDFALFPHLDVARNVTFGLRGSDWPGDRRRARLAELLELVGLEGYERRTPEALSGGERQRVALARALAPQPRLLMLDEPLGSLDRTLRERLLLELRAILARLAVPTLYVTHDQLEAFAVADRIAIMDAGQIVREGAPTDIYGDPRTEFVARFLGMDNILDGEGDGAGQVVTSLGRFDLDARPSGPVRVLLRSEGAALADGPGAGVVQGTLTSRLFQGARLRLQLQTVAGPLEFDLPADVGLPAEGDLVHVRTGAAQVLKASAT